MRLQVEPAGCSDVLNICTLQLSALHFQWSSPLHWLHQILVEPFCFSALFFKFMLSSWTLQSRMRSMRLCSCSGLWGSHKRACSHDNLSSIKINFQNVFLLDYFICFLSTACLCWRFQWKGVNTFTKPTNVCVLGHFYDWLLRVPHTASVTKKIHMSVLVSLHIPTKISWDVRNVDVELKPPIIKQTKWLIVLSHAGQLKSSSRTSPLTAFVLQESGLGSDTGLVYAGMTVGLDAYT